ncbi:MAG: hypothetical protein Q8L30_01820 [bacterium]|nr:hypothetical protein [bacterium]
MTTVVNTPPSTDGGGSGAGWAVAVIILLAVIGVGMYFWLNYRGAPAESGAIDVNVTLPQNPITDPTPTP